MADPVSLWEGWGLAGLFVSAFLAATILPLSSEVVFAALGSAGFAPVPLVLSATAGNLLGAVVNYYIGLYGADLVFHKWLGVSEQALKTAEKRFQKYGVFSLLLAWMPVIGDPLTFAAGILKVRFDLFLVLVGTGKCLRYCVLAWALVPGG